MRKLDHGSALISALFIMTLVAIAATAMSKRLQIEIHRARLTLTHDKLLLSSQIVTFWAIDQLLHPQLDKKPSDVAPHLTTFPTTLQHMYPDVLLQGKLLDLQGQFNLNNLIDKKWHTVFLKLLATTLPSQASQGKFIISSIENWISPYPAQNDSSKHLEPYLNQTPPYLSAHQFMQSKSELRLIMPKLSGPAYEKIGAFVTTLPETTPINVLTASPPVLRALGNGLSAEHVQEFITLRQKNGYEKADVLQIWLRKNNIPLEQITFVSQYYLCITTSSANNISLTTYTLFQRKTKSKGGFSLRILSQSINTL